MTTATQGPRSRVSLMVEQIRDAARRTANNKFTWIIAAALMGTPWVYTGVVDAFGIASRSGAESERLQQVERIARENRTDIVSIKISVARISEAVGANVTGEVTPQGMMQSRRWIGTSTVASNESVDQDTVRNWIEDGILPAVKDRQGEWQIPANYREMWGLDGDQP